MTAFNTTRRVAFSPRQMFDLVADVERYPQFLPLCEALTVRARREDGERRILIAEMTVGYLALRQSFTSRVLLDPVALTVRAGIAPEYPRGPFRKLANDWRFTAVAGGCEVVFAIDYEFASASLQVMVGGLFDRVFRRYTRAFEERAVAVYGSPAVAPQKTPQKT
jgi:coenzyme Q-binding protein COQ10